MRDLTGRTIRVGDLIAYATREGSCFSAQRLFVVREILENSIKVLGLTPDHYYARKQFIKTQISIGKRAVILNVADFNGNEDVTKLFTEYRRLGGSLQ